MPYTQSPENIFISFVHEDSDIASALANFLRKQGFLNIFLTADDWLVYAGEAWLDRIREELTSAKMVISLFSRYSMDRPWIHFEAGAAWLANKVLIPICIRGLTCSDLRIPYAGIQAVTLSDYSSAYYLIRSIYKHAPTNIWTMPPPFNRECDAWRNLENAMQTGKPD